MGKILSKIHYPYNHLKDCTHMKCEPGEYKCKIFSYCIPIDKVCDGLNHCWYGDDEISCG